MKTKMNKLNRLKVAISFEKRKIKKLIEERKRTRFPPFSCSFCKHVVGGIKSQCKCKISYMPGFAIKWNEDEM